MRGYNHKKNCNCKFCKGKSGFQKGVDHKGKNNSMYGVNRKGKCPWVAERNKKQIGELNPFFNKHHTKETKIKISENEERKKKISKKLKGRKNYWQEGEKHHNFNNWSSLKEYDFKFNDNFKKMIRKRDNFKCVCCDRTEKNNRRKLSIHHIDYNKQNSNPNNCVSLCVQCHTETNYNKNVWKNFFLDMLNYRYGYDVGTFMTTIIPEENPSLDKI